MKKFKLFALAIMAMLSTNAFAADGEILSTTVYRYEVVSEAGLTAKILGYVADYPAASMATTKIPATVAHPTADKAYKVIEIAADAFTANAENITAIDLSEAVNLVTIPAATFEGIKTTSLDLSATKVEVLNQLFESVGPKVESIVLPATLTTIAANAFEGMTKLTSIDFSACEEDITIEAEAFKNTMKITSFTVPAQVVSIEPDAFAGSYITALTIDATDDTHHLVVGDGTGGIGATKITTLTVNGAELTISEDAFADAAALATVTFNDDLVTGTVDTGAFVDQDGAATAYKLTVNYTPADDADDDAFAEDAFAAAEDAATYVTFKTSQTYGEALTAQVGWTTAGAWGVKLDYTALAPTIEVFNNGSGKFSYAGVTSPAGGITIAKKQGDANVMVYGAYFDYGTTAATSAIIMEQFHLIGGKYYIPEGVNFIVKSSSAEPVEYTEGDGGKNSQNYKYGNVAVNKIQAYDGGLGDPVYAIDIVTDAGKPLYFLKPIEEFGFGWSQFADDREVSEGQLYLVFNTADAAPARINVIWADGSEEDQVTGIQKINASVKKAGVIYNLAGQKVNAAYKGVVIKEGKKFIQK